MKNAMKEVDRMTADFHRLTKAVDEDNKKKADHLFGKRELVSIAGVKE